MVINVPLCGGHRASQVVLVVKNLPAKAGDAREVSLILGLGRSPGVGNGNALSPTPVFLPGKFHGQRSITGYSPWGHKDLDATEWAHGKHRACVEAFVTSAQFCYEPKTFTKNEVYPFKMRDKEKVRITLRFLPKQLGQWWWQYCAGDTGGEEGICGSGNSSTL